MIIPTNRSDVIRRWCIKRDFNLCLSAPINATVTGGLLGWLIWSIVISVSWFFRYRWSPLESLFSLLKATDFRTGTKLLADQQHGLTEASHNILLLFLFDTYAGYENDFSVKQCNCPLLSWCHQACSFGSLGDSAFGWRIVIATSNMIMKVMSTPNWRRLSVMVISCR